MQKLVSRGAVLSVISAFCSFYSLAASANDSSTVVQGANQTVNYETVKHSSAKVSSPDFATSFDGFQTEPLLNVGVVDTHETATSETEIVFKAYTNYDFWIDRAEIRISAEAPTGVINPNTILPVENGEARWQVPSDYIDTEIHYALRVYDENGQFDQTQAKSLHIVEPSLRESDQEETLPGFYGVDATAVRNIQVNGGAVTVYAKGDNLKTARGVRAFGKETVADVDGNIAVQQILPAGEHTIEASYIREDGRKVTVLRDVVIPDSEWFVVAVGDLTVGTRSNDSRALVEASGEEFDKTFVTGRAAFYLKGKIKGKYLLTASLDTTEDDIDNIFSNLNDKSPDSLLRRLDPDRFYPVYGDDSTFHEDAPTQGRFYVRLERGDDHIVWGNFLTNITQTEFAQLDRGLYGAKAEYNSDTTTDNGERRVRVTAFAADPGTIPAREEFRATGGSLYFFQNQDISIGSERLRIEYRDEDSGLVLESIELRPFEDYEFDYISGRVLLTRPLNSTQLGTQIVRDGTLDGRQTFLVARYEFSPSITDIDGFTLGGRAEAWLNNSIRLGITGQEEETGDVDQQTLAVDALIRKSDQTYLKGEISRSRGQGFNEQASIDGGFSFQTLSAAAIADSALAYRIEGAADLREVSSDLFPGHVNAYYENLEAGFSGAGRLTQGDTERYGTQLHLKLIDALQLDVKYDNVSIDNRLEEDTIEVDVRVAATEKLNIGLGVRHNDVSGPNAAFQGERTDLGLEARYQVKPSIGVYGFGQGTLSSDASRPEANRGGVGIDAKLSDRYGLRGEVSEGTGGVGAQAQLSYKAKEGEEYYLNYTLDAERTLSGVDGANFLGTSQNTLTAGGRKRYNSVFSVFGEERASFGDSSGITHAYGLDITPADKWSVGLSFEVGELEQGANIIDRQAYVVSAGYSGGDTNFGAAFEWLEDETNGVSRETWLLRSNLGLQVSDNWRGLLKFNIAESDSSDGTFFNGDFTEAQIAGAYRPVNNDRFNALLRYTFFEDFTSSAQFSNAGVNALPRQRSHILSVDGNYRTTDWLTIGGKLGYRSGQIALSRLDDDLITSNTLLLVGRADIHFVKNWDALAEIRYLEADLAGDSNLGILTAIYRHVGDNAKVGIGYNFTDFSDDLTDLSFNDNGVFLNIIAKY